MTNKNIIDYPEIALLWLSQEDFSSQNIDISEFSPEDYSTIAEMMKDELNESFSDIFHRAIDDFKQNQF
ncbi:hypothetical protein [Pleurocapsa sp. PCC 7319]|uniref:hypothetical protein n=1 Tax=Pleurocapsa sp. PCC 7319 TaxID=118161 RepID=UPI00034A3FD6|nr:hypothetical protein [Pleurocapsa sp. PCC 7319]